jgi:hypothetical protein
MRSMAARQGGAFPTSYEQQPWHLIFLRHLPVCTACTACTAEVMEDNFHLLLDISLAAQQPKLLKKVWRWQRSRHCPSPACMAAPPRC